MFMKNLAYNVLLSLLVAGIVLPNVFAAELSDKVPLDYEMTPYSKPWERYSKWTQKDWSNFNTLRKQDQSPKPKGLIKIEGEITGNPQNGQLLVADRRRGGSCYACHVFPGAALPGSVGPNLTTVGTWGRSDEHLYNYIYDPRTFNPVSVMPPWGAHGVFSDAEIRDIVSYLKTLRIPVKVPPLEDPMLRPRPIEQRDNLDPFENPGMWWTEIGETEYSKTHKSGQSCVACHAAPKKDFEKWATQMPKFSTKLNKVVGIEEFVARHAKATMDADILMQSEESLGLATYLRYLSNGYPMAVDTSDEQSAEAVKRGEALAKVKIGQLNFSCNDCHIINANKWIRGQMMAAYPGMLDHFPTYRTSRAELWDIRKRLQWCGVAVRANDLPPDAPEYGDIEMYLTTKNRGNIISVPGIRH